MKKKFKLGNYKLTLGIIIGIVILMMIDFIIFAMNNEINYPRGTHLSVLLIAFIALGGGYLNMECSRLHFNHIIMVAILAVCQLGMLVFSMDEHSTMQLKSLLLGFIPIALTLLPPILFMMTKGNKWHNVLGFLYLFGGVILQACLRNPYFFGHYCQLLMAGYGVLLVFMPPCQSIKEA